MSGSPDDGGDALAPPEFEADGTPPTGIGAVPDPTGADDFVIDFSARVVGERVRAVLRLRNSGRSTRRYDAQPVAAPFELERSTPLILEPGESGELGWYFRPTAEGSSAIVARVVSGHAVAAVRLVGEGFEPVLDCEPEVLDFGPALVGQKLLGTVICVNRARHPWSLMAGPIAGDHAEHFGVESVEATPIRPGWSWHLRVKATPGRAERLLAFLPLASTTGRAAGSIALGVTGITRALSCSPTTLDFGFVAAGGIGRATLRCVNASARPVPITDIALDPSSSPWFSWTPDVYPLEVPAAAGDVEGEVTVDVAFQPGPDEAGLRKNGILVIRTGDPNNARIDVRMTGFADGPRLSCSPTPLDFGVVASGLPVTRSLVCANDGYDDPSRIDDNLVITGVDTTDPEFTAAIRGSTRSAGYRVGETFTVDVTYSPTDEGVDLASVRFLSNDVFSSAAAPRAVELSGVGRVLPPCDFEVTPQNLRFGAVTKGSVATLEFAVKNRRTDAECVVQNVRLAPGCDPAFSLPSGGVAMALLHASERLRFPVRFAPTVERSTPYGCDVLLDISNPVTPHQVVHATGSSDVTCGLAPEELDFGTVEPGCATLDRWIQVFNTCATPLSVDAVDVGEGPSNEFSVRWRPPLPVVIGPGQDASFSVAYRPEDEGDDRGSVLIHLDGDPEPLLVMLRGSAAPDALQIDRFVQEDRRTDVLWVIDNATTMGPEQASLAANVSSFLEVARDQGTDFHLGVTSSSLNVAGGCPGGVGGGEDGRLVPVDRARPRILNRNTPNLEANLAANLGVGACAYQGQGMEAALRALFPPLATTCDDPRHPEPNDGNCGFRREDARLAIVAVTDGLDGSPGTVDFYYNALLALKGYRDRHLLQVHAIAGEAGRGCMLGSDTAAPGDRWIELAGRTVGGTFHSICTQDWATTLGELSKAVFGAPTCYSLTSEPEDTNGNWLVSDTEGEIAVWLDGVAYPSVVAGGKAWEYRPDLLAVCFDPLAVPPRGSQIAIRYRSACVIW